VFVQIDLADERFCDGCACLCVILAHQWEFDEDGAECHADSLIDVDVIETRNADGRWLRPQACIDASAAITSTLQAAVPAGELEPSLLDDDQGAQ